MKSVRLFVALLVLLSFTSIVAAQTTGAIEGTVRDATGAPVAGARVEITVGGRVRTVGSDSVGHYRLDGLPAGTYRVVATHVGLAPATLHATVADAAAPVPLDLTLGSVVTAESVSVTGIAPGASLDTPTRSASRLGLTARETPATLNVMTFTEAQARGLATTTEALARVPGVTAANLPSTFATSMRGFTAAAISTLYDGTRSTTSSMVMRNFDSWNVRSDRGAEGTRLGALRRRGAGRGHQLRDQAARLRPPPQRGAGVGRLARHRARGVRHHRTDRRRPAGRLPRRRRLRRRQRLGG